MRFLLNLVCIFSFGLAFAANHPFQVPEKSNHLESRVIVLHYADAKEIVTRLKDKNISYDERTNSVWLRGNVSQLEQWSAVIAQWDVPISQILIHARIVNADTQYESEMGVRLGIGSSLKENPPAQEMSLKNHLAVDMPATRLFDHPGRLGVAISSVGDGTLLDLELSAMQQDNWLSVVASPSLLVAQQQSAVIESGDEIPYEQSTKEGATTTTFKKAVLSLSVTPSILNDKDIVLLLSVNQDKPGVVTQNGVSIKTQHIKTRVIVQDKQTIVVGGIYETEEKNTVQKIPFLGDIPLLGFLFRHTIKENARRDLLIFITPEIVRA